jgi:aminopeptidase
MLVNEIIKQAYKAGAWPIYSLGDSRVQRQLLTGITKEHADLMAKFDKARMKEMDAYIGIRGGHNAYELSDVAGDRLEIYNKYYSHPVHHDIRVAKTKWVVLRYPNPSMAQLAGWATEKFEDFYFDVCNLDYAKMDKAMTPLVKLMEKTDKVRLTARDTDITFSIKGIKAVKCSGLRNIPDGEIYTAPVKDSVNGVIKYNAPSIHNGTKHENVMLTFKDGKIIKAEGNHTKRLNEVLDTDEGARYVGEFAIGVNPYITEATGDILFDEKISGSIHFTPGSCYDETDNGNKSAVHWDLVLIQTPEFGGGEIYFDGKLIRKDGRFVVKELECLNPENLK